jgi:D-lactate dehydrogenase
MNLTPKLRAIAEKCAKNVSMPMRPACCGQAGDRGFWIPELTRAATRKIEWTGAMYSESSEKKGSQKAHYSTSRTCEIALSENAAAAYTSVLELVLKASNAAARNNANSTPLRTSDPL